MDLVGPVIQLLQWISAPISRCWKYHCGLQKNVVTLKQSMEGLNCRRRDIDAEIVEGETEPKAEVQRWLQMVEKIDAEINTINQQVETVKCFRRAGIGKIVVQKIVEVKELHRNGKFPHGLVRRLPQRIGEMQPTTTLGRGATFTRKMEEVWALLMGDDVRKIGVYGMGGVGKTTLMQDIINRLLQSKEKFDSVILVTASKDSSIIRLQDAVASEIKFDDISKYDDERLRACKLNAKLSEIKRYVLIIDDLWDVYPLHKVGIPEPSPENESKLVLTTRLLNVCHGMSCKAIRMESLSETESFNLFLEIVGRQVLTNPEMEEIVNSVVKECASLPLAIVAIAGSLKGIDDDNEWKTALRDLKTSSKGDNKILEQLKFSYDRLNDKDLQECLLYCSLFPEDFAIARVRLIEYLIAEEIIKETDWQADLERGQTMINKLVRACLLEETTDRRGLPGCVKMHDLIRDMALQITSERPRFLVEAGMGLKRVPDEEKWKGGLARVSLMQNAISDIPLSFGSPRCPKLSTLLLNSNRSLHSISDNFFHHMTGLGLLDLSETSIENLPESVSELVNLTALLLRGCRQLMYVRSLAKLKALKRLDFYESGIKEVPQGMENLIRLRYLEFGECRQLEIIPDGIFCKLLNLRYLSLNNQVRGPTTRGEELVSLTKLERLYCVLHDLNGFNAYVRSLAERGPAYYILQLGFSCPMQWRPVHKHGKVVFLADCDIRESVAKGGDRPLLLPQDVESLAIYKCCINVSSLCELTSFKNATKFKCCYIAYCGELEHLFVYSSSIIRLLQGLEELYLYNVRDLQGLIRRENLSSSPLPPGTFCSLKWLRVCHCHNIKRLSIVAPLPNLEEIGVVACEQLVEIVATASNNDEEEEDQEHVEAAGGRSHQAVGVVTLPKLWNLHLTSLPKLKSIPVIADNSLRDVRIWECPKLKKVPCLDRVPFPVSLRSVHIGEDMWESLEWDHPSAKDAIQSMSSDSE